MNPFVTRLKKLFLWLLIVSLILTALMGIYVFLLGSWGYFEERCLLTTLSVAFFSMTALASAALLARRRGFLLAVPLSALGIGVAVMGLPLSLGAIWIRGLSNNDEVVKTVMVAAIFSFSFGQASVLGLAPMRGRLRWVYWTTLCAIGALAVTGSAMIFFEIDDEPFFRALGVMGILDGCGTLVTPILAKLYGVRRAERAADRAIADQVDLFCPRCGLRSAYPLGDITCADCGLKLRVTVAEEEKSSPAPQPT